DLDAAHRPALLDQLRKARTVLRLARRVCLEVSFGGLHRAHRNPLTDEFLVGGKFDLTDFGAEIRECALRFEQGRHDLRVYAFLRVFAIYANPETAYAIADPGEIIRNG